MSAAAPLPRSCAHPPAPRARAPHAHPPTHTCAPSRPSWCGRSTAGDFPFWLAPVQLRLLPVSDDFRPYCDEVVAAATALGIRAEVDIGGRSLGKQIKVSNAEKVSAFAVVGEKEVEGRSLSITSRVPIGERAPGDLGSMSMDAALAAMVGASVQD